MPTRGHVVSTCRWQEQAAGGGWEHRELGSEGRVGPVGQSSGRWAQLASSGKAGQVGGGHSWREWAADNGRRVAGAADEAIRNEMGAQLKNIIGQLLSVQINNFKMSLSSVDSTGPSPNSPPSDEEYVDVLKASVAAAPDFPTDSHRETRHRSPSFASDLTKVVNRQEKTTCSENLKAAKCCGQWDFAAAVLLLHAAAISVAVSSRFNTLYCIEVGLNSRTSWTLLRHELQLHAAATKHMQTFCSSSLRQSAMANWHQSAANLRSAEAVLFMSAAGSHDRAAM
ncbi:hypothetical protein GGX14DRAFT_404594 [Mycena pura]|uniref:Uncharacterized protein n=1 Tax=Mycena pura TaxID=153505 RepID=A0AAD6UY24_9AGAR|nr:hypothetical protein GGX14DRAFT_404594 [Mycena pura]